MLTRTSSRPLPIQLADAIREEIISGAWPAGFQLRNEADLAREYGVARATLHKAVTMLVTEKLLVQAHGRGTFVRDPEGDAGLGQRLVTMTEILRATGRRFVTEILGQTITLAGDADDDIPARDLLHAGAAGILRLHRRLIVDGAPYVLLDNRVRLDQCPGLEAVDFRALSLFAAIEQTSGHLVTAGRRTFDAVADANRAAQLGIEPAAPLLHIEQLTALDNGVAVEYSDVWMSGERLRVTTTVTR